MKVKSMKNRSVYLGITANHVDREQLKENVLLKEITFIKGPGVPQ